MGKENFILAVARDGRSYKPANFEKAADIIRKWSLKSPEELRRWGQMQKKVQEARLADEQAEEDLGEIPDEFLGMVPCYGLIFRELLTFFRSPDVHSHGRPCHSPWLTCLHRPSYYPLASP
jgi:hypothetical protein